MVNEAREAPTGVAGALRIGIYSRISCGPHWQQILQTFGDADDMVATSFA